MIATHRGKETHRENANVQHNHSQIHTNTNERHATRPLFSQQANAINEKENHGRRRRSKRCRRVMKWVVITLGAGSYVWTLFNMRDLLEDNYPHPIRVAKEFDITHGKKPRNMAEKNLSETPIDLLKFDVIEDNATLFWGLDGKATSSAGEGLLHPLSPDILALLDDETVDPDQERKRCEQYKFEYDGRLTRRRIFWGSLIADDSFRVLQTVGTEGRNLFHSVSFVESNTTQTLSARKWRFTPGSIELDALREIFGDKTLVTVDYYVDGPRPSKYLHREHQQRQAVLHRWKRNGMTQQDLAFFGDADEMFTRDFLRALQICDVPEFRPGQDCRSPKIIGAGIHFEASPECIIDKYRWYRPDVLLGECVDLIGDDKLHPAPLRTLRESQSFREKGHGGGGSSYEKYFEANPSAAGNDSGKRAMYPLWNGGDIRRISGHRQVFGRAKTQTCFHLHNFFVSGPELRRKYMTYAEPLAKASKVPLSLIHRDISTAVACSHGWPNLNQRPLVDGGLKAVKGPIPILFCDADFVRLRHEEWMGIVVADEDIYGAVNANCSSTKCESCPTSKHCDGYNTPGEVLIALSKLGNTTARDTIKAYVKGLESRQIDLD